MKFNIVSRNCVMTNSEIVYLTNDNWNDYFEYRTMYQMYYKNQHIGGVRIGRIGQTEDRPDIPDEFETLPTDYFSLGVSLEYYKNLKREGIPRVEILTAVHDIAYDLKLLETVREERVTQRSLMRDFSYYAVKEQFHRIADGGAVLTDYDFKYILPDKDITTGENLELDFYVEGENNTPPSNIYVLIGKNGIGKTTIIKKMLKTLLCNNDLHTYGEFITGWGGNFSNIVNISFSMFDDPITEVDVFDKMIFYKYIGLIDVRYENDIRKRNVKYDQLPDMFFESYWNVIKSITKNELWKRSVKILETDSTFKELDIGSWISQEKSEFEKKILATEKSIEEKNNTEKNFFRKIINNQFSKLSSGHKIILLTVVNLVNFVEEKTLVIMDEPEEHLHPPLVSAFIRALSELMSYRNGVAIIATHSPVIVQEVPRRCVWKIRGHGKYRKFEHPEIETFGENLGEITTEIFGYDVGSTGFHTILKNVANRKNSYEKALNEFQGELGKEAKSILRAYMYDKENT